MASLPLSRIKLSHLVLGFSLLLSFSTLWGQQETGSITGQVVDPSGAVVPAAQVTVVNAATNATFTTNTNTSGLYRVPQLAPGTYELTVSAAGFATLTRPNVDVRVNDRLRVDFALAVGNVTETITVDAAPPLLQAEDATAGQVIDNKNIVDLPLNGRNWLQLATLAPATVTYPGVVDLGLGNSQGVLMNLGGTRTNQNNYLLNGTDNTAFVSSGGAIAYPPVDSLQEFKVQTNNYTADTGRLAGAVINASIKSGTNSFHGTAYEFLRNRSLNARNFFAQPDQPKPQFTRNQFGASIGGPFVRNKLFFFWNYEGNRQREASTQSRQLFTRAEQTGDFSATLGSQVGVDALGRPVRSGQVFDPFSGRQLSDGTFVRDAVPGNVIPASLLNPVSRPLMDAVPLPNSSGAPNFIRTLSSPLNVDTFVSRLDWVHSEKNSFTGHFVHSGQSAYVEPLLGLPIDGGGNSFNNVDQRQFGLGWTHVMSPTTLNELRFGYVRNAKRTFPEQSAQDINTQFGIPIPQQTPFSGGLASIGISGFATIGTPAFMGNQFVDKFEILDSFTVIAGRHTLKFGARAAQKTFYNQVNCAWCRGDIRFNGVFSRQPGFNASGNAAADFLFGTMNSFRLARPINGKDVGRDFDWYVQDRMNLSSKLTVTLGIRYQYNPPSWEARDMMSSVNFDAGFANPRVVVPKGQDEAVFQQMRDVWFPFIPVERATHLDRGLVRNKNSNFAPRLGIAYQIGQRTVIRGGYGVFFGFPDIVSGSVLTVNPPAQLVVTTSSNTFDPTLLIDEPIFGPDPFNQSLVNPGFLSIRAEDLPPEFVQMYNLTVQHELANDLLLEVGYLGNRASRIAVVTQINDARPALPNDTSAPQSRRIVSPVLGNLPYLAPQGFSNYNAFIVNIEKRFSDGLSLLANYTWSRALGVAPAVTNTINSSAVQNPLDLSREYGPLEFDVINRVSMSSTYELPFGAGRRFLGGASGVVEQIIGGWQVAAITTFQGGFSLTPGLSISLGRTFTNSRPNIIGDTTDAPRQPYQFLNRAAFAIPTNGEVAAGNFFGNAGWGSIRSAGLVNLDLSFMKNFQLAEQLRLQFRGELFNLTNTPYFGGPGALNTNFSSSAFGTIGNAGPPRVVQFGLKLIF